MKNRKAAPVCAACPAPPLNPAHRKLAELRAFLQCVKIRADRRGDILCERFRGDDIEKRKHAAPEECLALAPPGFIEHREENEIEAAVHQKRQAEKRDVRLNAGVIASRGIDLCRNYRKRDGDEDVGKLQQRHGEHAGAHHVALAHRQERGIKNVVLGAVGFEREEYAEHQIEKADIIGIRRHKQQRREREEDIHARTDGEPELLVQQIFHSLPSRSMCTMMSSMPMGSAARPEAIASSVFIIASKPKFCSRRPMALSFTASVSSSLPPVTLR